MNVYPILLSLLLSINAISILNAMESKSSLELRKSNQPNIDELRNKFNNLKEKSAEFTDEFREFFGNWHVMTPHAIAASSARLPKLIQKQNQLISEIDALISEIGDIVALAGEKKELEDIRHELINLMYSIRVG